MLETKKKQKSKSGKNKGQVRTIIQEEPKQSFFQYFSEPIEVKWLLLNILSLIFTVEAVTIEFLKGNSSFLNLLILCVSNLCNDYPGR